MVILHIASVNDDLCAGVSVAVPQHIISQQKIAEVGFVNLTNIKIAGIKNQFEYKKTFSIKDLEPPFSSPDIVIFHEIYRPEYFQISRNLRQNNIPYIILAHGGFTKEAQKKKRLKKLVANNTFFRSYIKNATAFQCLSELEIKNSLSKKMKFIGTNGVFVPDRIKENFSKSEVRIIYIGRLEVHIKGIDLMLEAVSSVADFMREKNAVLNIYGPEVLNWVDEIKSIIAEKDIGDIVKVNSAITGVNKENALIESDLFIQTSRTEGMPMSILEAMSYGVPCIVTEGTNMGEFVERYDSGWVAQTSSEAIAEAIKKAVLDRVNWKSKSSNARKLIEDEFSWDKVSKETIETYKEIIRELKK